MDYQQADETSNQQAATSNEGVADVASDSSAQGDEGAAVHKIETEPARKKTLKETVKHEAREIFVIILYLGCWLSVLATMKSLVLLQYGMNEFKNAYIMAWVTAVALAKVIVLAQKLPIVNTMRHRPLFWACIYKASFFTLITLFAHRVEERAIHAAADPNNVFPLAGVIAHALSLSAIFFILFVYRDLDLMLGQGTLKKMFFKSRKT